jgi:NADPH:quinone reductase-like Zn-dependent oxidoreductase
VTLTGSELVDEGVRPRAGDTVLVTGALGSVGRAAVYTAKARGAKVWAGVRSTQRSAASELGVDGVVVLDDPDASDQLPVFDGVADTVGGATTQKLLDNIRRGGSIATVLDEPPGARERGLEARKIWAHPDPERLATLLRALAAGTLVIPIAKRFQLSQIRAAHEAAQRGAGGKVLVQM